MINILGSSTFDQCVINMSLIHLCDQTSYVGQQMQKFYSNWKDETNQPVENLWHDLHWFTIFVPHRDQQYDGLTLEQGLTLGYNIEVKPVEDKTEVPYQIPNGGHFVVVLKQKGLDQDFAIAATGIFIRPLAVLSLDVIVDLDKGESQPILVKHPIVRQYPSDWQNKANMFINNQIRSEELPNVVKYVDRTYNPDYCSPSWDEVRSFAKSFAGV